jgi:hypothetical protein
MKELILDNPPRRKGKSKKRRSAAQRRATAKMLAANRRKRKGSKSTKRRTKRTKRTTVKRRRTSTKRTYKSMARKTRKSSRRRKAHSRRRKTHTSLVRGSATPIKLNGLIGGIFSKDNLMIAGGAVAASVVSNYALNSTYATKLPMVTQPYARAAYLTLVPVIGGVLLRKVSPNIAKGMIIGGLVNGIAQLITATKLLPPGQTVATQTATAGTTAGTSAYLGEYLGQDSSYLGEYLGDDFEEASNMNIESTGSFADSAW